MLRTTRFLLNKDETKSGLLQDYAYIPDPTILDPDVTFFQAPYLAHVRSNIYRSCCRSSILSEIVLLGLSICMKLMRCTRMFDTLIGFVFTQCVEERNILQFVESVGSSMKGFRFMQN